MSPRDFFRNIMTGLKCCRASPPTTTLILSVIGSFASGIALRNFFLIFKSLVDFC